MKANKYNYCKVIQQHFGAYGWEDVSQYETNSKGELIGQDKEGSKFETYINKHGKERKREITLLQQDFKEYLTCGYPTRVIFRKVQAVSNPINATI